MGDTCVYTPDNDLVSTWTDQAHSSIPKVYYYGDSQQTSLQALESVTTSRSATSTTLGGTSVYKLEYSFDIGDMNDLIDSSSKQLDEAEDSWSETVYINASSGAPVQFEGSVTADDTTSTVRTEWSNVNTSPTIPQGTFGLTEDEPSMTFDEALEDWATEQLGL